MSIHANQPVKGGPSSNREEIRGSNATYRTSVQKESKTASSTKPANQGSDGKKVEGEGSAPVMQDAKNVAGYGDGHYTPNK